MYVSFKNRIRMLRILEPYRPPSHYASRCLLWSGDGHIHRQLICVGSNMKWVPDRRMLNRVPRCLFQTLVSLEHFVTNTVVSHLRAFCNQNLMSTYEHCT